MDAAAVRHEIEAKYRLSGPEEAARLRERLIVLNAEPGGGVAEDNVLFDYPDRALGRQDRLLRLRVLGGGPGGLLTYKGPATRDGPLKSRVEHETAVADAATARAILEGLGYVPTVQYAKQRETWRLDGAEVALDVLVFGHYCEIEGSPATIERLAAALALPPEAAEPAGYPALTARYQAALRR